MSQSVYFGIDRLQKLQFQRNTKGSDEYKDQYIKSSCQYNKHIGDEDMNLIHGLNESR